MSNFESLYRWTKIIQKLRRQNASFDEINFMLQNLSEQDGYRYDISLRSFQRDIKKIAQLFDIEIRYNRKRQYYYIASDDISTYKDRLLESFDLIHALKTTSQISAEVQFEKQHSPGTENLLGLLHSIRNGLQVHFVYTKFWDDKPTLRTINPYGLKEYRNRWYLVGGVPGENQIKCFGLDRLSELEISKTHFGKPGSFDINRYFQYSYGVIGPENDSQPEHIELSYTPFQAKYIKSLPLHHTQKVISDTQKEVRISLQMHITHDFIMDLLSWGAEVKVIKPLWLAKDIKSKHAMAAKRYK